MDIAQEVELVKKELAELIISHLKDNQIKPEDAKQLAKSFLDALPIQDQKDLLEKLKSLGENYKEAKQIYVEELGKFEEDKTQQTLSQMRTHIQNGNINEAVETAKTMSKGGI